MNESDDGETNLIIRNATSVFTALAAAVASDRGQTDLATLIAITSPVAPDIGVHLKNQALSKLRSLVPPFFRGVEAAAGKPTAQAVKNEKDAEALYEAYRRLADTAEPFAAMALGRLAGLYMRENYRVDQFFRAAGRTIEELGPEEYDTMQKIVSGAGERVAGLRQKTSTHAVQISINPPSTNRTQTGGEELIYYQRDDMWHPLLDPSERPILKTPSTARVFFLLRAQGLTTEVPGVSSYRGTTPSEFAALDIEMVAPRLREVLRPRDRDD